MRKCTIKGKIKLVVNKGEVIELDYNKEGKIDGDTFYPNGIKKKSYQVTQSKDMFNSFKFDVVYIENIKYTRKRRKW